MHAAAGSELYGIWKYINKTIFAGLDTGGSSSGGCKMQPCLGQRSF